LVWERGGLRFLYTTADGKRRKEMTITEREQQIREGLGKAIDRERGRARRVHFLVVLSIVVALGASTAAGIAAFFAPNVPREIVGVLAFLPAVIASG